MCLILGLWIKVIMQVEVWAPKWAWAHKWKWLKVVYVKKLAWYTPKWASTPNWVYGKKFVGAPLIDICPKLVANLGNLKNGLNPKGEILKCCQFFHTKQCNRFQDSQEFYILLVYSEVRSFKKISGLFTLRKDWLYTHSHYSKGASTSLPINSNH